MTVDMVITANHLRIASMCEQINREHHHTNRKFVKSSAPLIDDHHQKNKEDLECCGGG